MRMQLLFYPDWARQHEKKMWRSVALAVPMPSELRRKLISLLTKPHFFLLASEFIPTANAVFFVSMGNCPAFLLRECFRCPLKCERTAYFHQIQFGVWTKVDSEWCNQLNEEIHSNKQQFHCRNNHFHLNAFACGVLFRNWLCSSLIDDGKIWIAIQTCIVFSTIHGDEVCSLLPQILSVTMEDFRKWRKFTIIFRA